MSKFLSRIGYETRGLCRTLSSEWKHSTSRVSRSLLLRACSDRGTNTLDCDSVTNPSTNETTHKGTVTIAVRQSVCGTDTVTVRKSNLRADTITESESVQGTITISDFASVANSNSTPFGCSYGI